MNKQPDILFVMTDQQRFDTIAAMGNGMIYTPNMDRLVRRGASFTNAYSTCPVCVTARLRPQPAAACRRPGALDALAGDDLKTFPFQPWVWKGERVYQFDSSRGIVGFPDRPEAILPARGAT